MRLVCWSEYKLKENIFNIGSSDEVKEIEIIIETL